MLVSLCKNYIQILQKIVENPQAERYRSIKSNSNFMNTYFEPHHGSYAILRLLGFQLRDNVWLMESANLEFLNEEMEKFQKIIHSSRTYYFLNLVV